MVAKNRRTRRKMVKSCKGCTLVLAPNPPHTMRRRQMLTAAWIDIAVDFMGPLPSGDHLFVVVDYFSRCKGIKIMKTITSATTIKALKEIFLRLGFPISITSDNGRQFISEEIKLFCSENGIKMYYRIPYWPQMNGEVEPQNRDILKRLKISQALKSDWEQELLDYIMMYNSTPHSTTGKTPSELFFPRQFRDKIPSSADIIMDKDVRERDKIQKEKGKEYADHKRKAADDIDLQIGDKVYQKNVIKENKITPNFDSMPHTVVNKKGGDVTVRNDNSGQESRRNVVHLKKVEGEWRVCNEQSEKID